MDVSRASSHDLGRRGEALAAAHLISNGVQLECANYRGKYGEIDLIGWDDGVLVFYEVKTRSGCLPGVSPFSSVTHSKLRKITTTARQFMCERFGREVNSRLAVVSVVSDRCTGVTIEVVPLG